MKLITKLATATGALGLAATGALATLGSGSAAATVPAVVHLASTSNAIPSQLTPIPAPNSGSSTTVEPATAEGPDTGAEAATEQASEPAQPGGGHSDAPGANVDHQFDGVE